MFQIGGAGGDSGDNVVFADEFSVTTLSPVTTSRRVIRVSTPDEFEAC